jgi:hypothetical protein
VAWLARLVQSKFTASGRSVKIGSVVAYIRRGLRAWEKEHPKR